MLLRDTKIIELINMRSWTPLYLVYHRADALASLCGLSAPKHIAVVLHIQQLQCYDVNRIPGTVSGSETTCR